MAVEQKFGKVGVLMGGPSTEREVSLKSGKAVLEALIQRGVDAIGIDIKSDNTNENIVLLNSKKIDCAFIALHGRFGEDGQIQAILESLKMPYTGPGVQASKLAMDKVSSHRIFAQGHLNAPKYQVLSKNSNWELDPLLGFPLVVKPASHGSSIGLSIIDKQADLDKAVNFAFSFDNRVILEEYIKGREMTVGILNDKALPVIEIVTKREFFDYEAKYHSGFTEYIVPAKIPAKIADKVSLAALKAYNLLGCHGCSRVDIILDEGNMPFVLEVNTIPGMTSTSLLPKSAKCAGMNFPDLCLQLITLAYEKTKI